MNEGSHAGEAVGFALESLPRLWSTKGSDKKTTVLDFVVRMVLAKDPDLADLPKDLVVVSKCRAAVQSDLINRVQRIQLRLKKQLPYVRGSGGSGKSGGSGGSGGMELYETKEANERFGQHVRGVENHVAMLVQNKEALVERSGSLAKYWGEDPKTFTTERVFNVLHDFCVAFTNSVKRCQMETKKRSKAAGKKMARGGGGGLMGSLSSSPMLAQVALQKRRQAVRGGDDEDSD
jgi:formin 2